MSTHMHPRLRKPYVPVAERRRMEQVRARLHCSRGNHRMSDTFRPGEQVCLVCGLITYCPACLDQAGVPRPQAERAYPMECTPHRDAGRGAPS